jgi:hypothetical protein
MQNTPNYDDSNKRTTKHWQTHSKILAGIYKINKVNLDNILSQ